LCLQLTRLSFTFFSFPLLLSIFLSNLSSACSALSTPFTSRFLCLLLICLDFFDFFVTPAAWWIARTEGRGGVALGGFAFLSDLSRLREGEEALLAAREWRDGAVGFGDEVRIVYSLRTERKAIKRGPAQRLRPSLTFVENFLKRAGTGILFTYSSFLFLQSSPWFSWYLRLQSLPKVCVSCAKKCKLPPQIWKVSSAALCSREPGESTSTTEYFNSSILHQRFCILP
jgi:hypothetical protein